MSSTPPESMDHAWSRIYCREAMDENRYFIGKCIDNEDWHEEDDCRMLELFRSKESHEWRREMLCEHISDPTRLVIPEFDEEKHTVEEYARPEHILPLIVADGGYVDYFACLYGYVDFQRQKLVIEDSIVVNRKNLGELSVLINAKKSQLYGNYELSPSGAVEVNYPVKPRQYADMRPLELATLCDVYKLYFNPPEEREDPDALIAQCRDRFFKNQITILRKNEVLIRQLKNAIRDEKGRLTRSSEYGHWDAVMALVYMTRCAPWRTNPGYENSKEYNWSTHQIPKGAFNEMRSTFTRSGIRRSTRKRWIK